MASTLLDSSRPLAAAHDVALLDLDGVVYVGPDAVPGAPQALAAARGLGMRLAFVTNNAARPPYVVADHLTELGIEAESAEVITSSQAAARYLAERLPGGARVLVVGTTGLEVALSERGLTPVSDASGRVDAIVQGYSPTLDWKMLAEGAVAINNGLLWVATNVDPTVPSPRGPLPGNGSLVAALKLATGREPVVTGKPDPTMHRETVIRTQAETPIVVGDRLDTDIEGANAVGCPSLLVFSGVTTPMELISAVDKHRPSYLGADVSALLQTHAAPVRADGGWVCGRWIATRDDTGALRLGPSGEQWQAEDTDATSAAYATIGSLRDTDLDALRALCSASWNDGAPSTRVVATADSVETADTVDRLALTG